MATKPAPKAAPAAEAASAPAPKKGKKGLIIGLIAAVLAGGGGGGWFWMSREAAAKAGGKPAEEAKHPPQFVPLEQFTVNLLEADRYLQVSVVLEVKGGEVGEAIKAYQPIIRNRILLLLSNKHAEELAGVEGKQKLAEEILVATREPLPNPKHATKEESDKGVEGVHFAHFVVQ
jgi:flagellar FliL protein